MVNHAERSRKAWASRKAMQRARAEGRAMTPHERLELRMAGAGDARGSQTDRASREPISVIMARIRAAASQA